MADEIGDYFITERALCEQQVIGNHHIPLSRTDVRNLSASQQQSLWYRLKSIVDPDQGDGRFQELVEDLKEIAKEHARGVQSRKLQRATAEIDGIGDFLLKTRSKWTH